MAEPVKPCEWGPFGEHFWEESCDVHLHYRCKHCFMDTSDFMGYYEVESETPCPGSSGDGGSSTIECVLSRIHRGEEL